MELMLSILGVRMIVDLSYTIYNNMESYPGNPDVIVNTLDLTKDVGFNVTTISMGVHTSTHVDTPLHCVHEKPTVENIDLKHYVGKAYCVDIETKKGDTIKFPKNFDFNKLKECDIILVRTGWENKISTSEYFDNWPYIDESFTKKLVELKIKSIGLDTPSVDSLKTNNCIHNILFNNDIAVIECLVNLNKVKDKNLFFSAAPLKIKGAEGSPVRAYAIVD